jgi:hypothetical protein
MSVKPRKEPAGFDFQIKESEESFAWSTEKVEKLLVSLDDGYKPKSSPFYEGNPNLKKSNIVFNYTQEELKELRKCATDIVYFANNYCTVMTDKGLRTIELRPYQEDMLRLFQSERFSVVLASRQVGKCTLSSTKIIILTDGKGIETTMGRLYFETIRLHRKLTIFEKAKYFLWKLYEKLDSFDRKQAKS